MYKSCYQFCEKPFALLPDPKFLYIGQNYRETLAKMRASVTNHAGMVLITGEIGCGKTTLVQHLKSHLDEDLTVGYISNTHKAFERLLPWVLNAFNVKFEDTMSDVKLHQAFLGFLEQEHARHRRALLIVDEAQNLSIQFLEELRLLSNVNVENQMLQIILVGQPELRDVLRRTDMLQFQQRIVVDHHLEPLDNKDTQLYIRHRVKVAGGDPELFEPQACDLIYKYSNGVPRLINSISDNVLMVGHEQGKKTINAGLVNEMVVNVERYDSIVMNKDLINVGKNTVHEKVQNVSDSDQQRTQAKQIVQKEGQLINQYSISEDCCAIGREKSNDVHLPDKRVSRIHARILSSSKGNFLEDLNSTNGTFVNSERISRFTLRDGDVITIGKYRLSYQDGSSFSHHESKSTDTPEPRFGLDVVLTEEKQDPDDITIISPQHTEMEITNYNVSIDKFSKKQDLAQVLKTLEGMLD